MLTVTRTEGIQTRKNNKNKDLNYLMKVIICFNLQNKYGDEAEEETKSKLSFS